jgi:hypothetical protein
MTKKATRRPEPPKGRKHAMSPSALRGGPQDRAGDEISDRAGTRLPPNVSLGEPDHRQK